MSPLSPSVCDPANPDDPYYVIGETEVGDLSEVEAVMEIETCFGVSFPEEWFQMDDLLSFGQMVSYIDEMTRPNHAPTLGD